MQIFSSISKKVIVALSGAFLMIFLILHLCINLLVLKGDDGETFSKIASFMGTNPIIQTLQIVLFTAIILMVVFTLILQIQNWFARPIWYKVSTKTETSFFSRYMIYTGVIILIFLIIHFYNFFFIKMGWIETPPGIEDKHDMYGLIVNLFSNTYYSIFYIVALIALGLHLYHAFQAAFQTLGLNHSKYMKPIKVIGAIYAICISVGFILIPLYFQFIY